MLSVWLREYLHFALGGDRIWEKILVKWEQNKIVEWLFECLPPEEMRPEQKLRGRAPNFKKEAPLPQPVVVSPTQD